MALGGTGTAARGWLVAVCAATVLATGIGPAGTAVAAGRAAAAAPQRTLQPGQVVSETPALDGPQIRDGRVQALAQVGDLVVVGGTFTQVSDAGSPVQERRFLVAYSRTTNRMSTTFAPVLNGQVFAAVPGPLPGTVWVAGDFTTVNGVSASRIALLDAATGLAVPGFRSPGFNGRVRAVAPTPGGLVVGGSFTRAGGKPRGGLASLDPLTGRLTTFAVATYLEHHNWGRYPDSELAPVGVYEAAASPDGTTLVTIGNFRTVDGVTHNQIALLDLTGPTAAVRHDWTTPYFTDPCYPRVADSWVRDVDWAPDGSYFVVGSTGGSNREACDAVVRFDAGLSGPAVQPRWIASTGGDSIYTVEATDDAIYAGGHFRWFNNVKVVDIAGGGAVARPGIVALDPDTGLPLPWNPGRHPRDKGVFALLATDSELLLGTDTDWVGNREHRTYRLARFPLAGGRLLTPTTPPALPGHLVALDPTGAVLTRRVLTPTGLGPVDTPLTIEPLGATRGATVIGPDLFTVAADGSLHRRSWDGATPGPDTVLHPYSDPRWDAVLTGVRPGQTYLGKESGLATEMVSATGMFWLDGRLYYLRPGFGTTPGTLKYRLFEPGSGTSHPVPVVAARLPVKARAVTWAAGTLYWSLTDGTLWQAPFDGTTLGTATVVGGPAVDGVSYAGATLFVSPTTTPPGS